MAHLIYKNKFSIAYDDIYGSDYNMGKVSEQRIANLLDRAVGYLAFSFEKNVERVFLLKPEEIELKYFLPNDKQTPGGYFFDKEGKILCSALLEHINNEPLNSSNVNTMKLEDIILYSFPADTAYRIGF